MMNDLTLLQRIRKDFGLQGWVDIQVNGHAGISFCSENLTLDQVSDAVDKLDQAGTTLFLPTVVTTPPETMLHCLRVLGEACDHPDLRKHLGGIHLEGPYLSTEPGAKGAHPPEYMHPPNLEEFHRFQEAARGHIKILTLAPELEGAPAFVDRVTTEGVVCSAGHTLATYSDFRIAVDAGLRLGTHIGNGIPAEVRRHENPIFAQLAIPEIVPSLITDGFHLPEGFIRAIFASKRDNGCLVISDQTHLAGMPPGEYLLGVTPVVLEEDGFLHMRDEPYLAGSSRTMAECMEHLNGLGFLDDNQLVDLGYRNPLKALGRAPTI
ncbi:MAG: N-acetylglucosamine-6-phosphate deacetylase [Candidatus Omnitrophica bacterium]|nr:N-acetylglucosamine-6-phosphate deacetylase [Candidatus Omnitrophota bacterium]